MTAVAAAPDPVQLLRELIRFDTTNPPGDEAACIAHVRALVEAAGVTTQTYAKVPGRPNLIARLAGRGEAPPLLLQGHVDVVTTSGQAWSRPPFAAEIEDGVVWGRGALDMKGGVSMMVTAFLRTATEGTPPPGDVILCVLADEEQGGDLGARFLVEEHPELFDGVRFAIGEFGGFALHVGGRRFYPIQVTEKQICWLKATFTGPAGHGSLPIRGGAMARLGRALAALDRKRTPIHVTPVARRWISTMADALPRAQATLLRSLLNPRLADASLRAAGPKLALVAPALRNTVSPTIVRGGDKVNVIPTSVELELDGRLLPGFAPDDLIRELRDIIGDDAALEVVRHDPGPGEPDLTHLDTLGRVIKELDPEAIPVPLLMPGVTDGRFFAQLGIQTYGFMPMNLPQGFEFTKMIHAADERIPADAVRFGAEAVYRAVTRLR